MVLLPCLVQALASTHHPWPNKVVVKFWLSFMLLQCAVTGFSPPRLMGTYVLGLKRD